MTVQFLFWVIVAVFIAACVICLQVGYRIGVEDREPKPDKYDRFWPELDQEPDPGPDRFALALAELVENDRIDERPYLYPRAISDTGGLRGLAYEGDMSAIRAKVDEWKKEIDTA